MKAFPLRACGMAVGAAVLLGGCSSLPLGDVPIVDRSVPTSGEHTTAGSQSSSFAPLGDVRDSGRTHTVTVGDTIYNISVRYGVTPSAQCRHGSDAARYRPCASYSGINGRAA